MGVSRRPLEFARRSGGLVLSPYKTTFSERCDRVVNAVEDIAVGDIAVEDVAVEDIAVEDIAVEDIAVEAEALAWKPDRHAALMARHLHDGMTALVDGFTKLRHDFDEAGVAADQARVQARTVVGRYRDAIAEIYRSDDLQPAVIARELYRPYARAADRLEAVADRLWYVVLANV